MRRTFLTISFLFSAYCLNAQIIINEVMYAPTSPQKEWFEIYNRSNAVYNLKNWKWRDAASSHSNKIITTEDVFIQPNSFAIVCEDSLDIKAAYPNITGIILQSLGWNALNNTGYENVVLYDSSLNDIDSLTYHNSWGGSNGYSLERINPFGQTNNQNNWGTSLSINKGTPNFQNSLTPKQYDLYLKAFTISPFYPIAGDSLNFKFVIKNVGLNPANNFSLNIYRDFNFDSIPQPGEIIYAQNYSTFTINPNDSLIYFFTVYNIDSGLKQFIGKIFYQADNDTTNNILVKKINVGGIIATSGLIINEIMYAPQSPEPEWVELFNNSPNPVNIKNWKIADSTAQSFPITITTTDRFVNAMDYIVIARNSSILSVHHRIDSSKIIYLSSLPTYNNDKDKVILFNNANTIMDHVSYKSSWGGSSRSSLERISPNRISQDSSNWSSSFDCEYSSPTRTNSIINLSGYIRNDLIINEIMYDPLTGNSEWIELYNTTYKYLNLLGWKISISGNESNLFDTCDFIISPNEFLVFATDTTIYKRFPDLKKIDSTKRLLFNQSISLNNSGAMIKLSDALNNVIDSVYYNPKWHNNNIPDTKGYSLERINPLIGSNDRSNWSSCTAPNGGTPGKKNSIYTQNQNSSSNISVNPNPFSPDGDGFEDFTIINYKIKSRIAQLRVKVFDVKGRLVRTLLNNQLSGSEGQIIFDGKNDSGEKLRIGIYILFLEAIDDKGGTVEQVKTTVVIAAKL